MANWLITGGCGFIGLNLVKKLLEERNNVRIIDNLSVGKIEDLELVCDYKERYPTGFKDTAVELLVADIDDSFYANEAMKDIDYVVHLAAVSGVRVSVTNPSFSFKTNVVGTFNLLEAAKINNIKKFIFASSGASVGEHEPPIHEKLPANPISPYGATKLAGEGLCTSFYHSFGIETVSLRFSNVYGPFSHHKDSLVAKLTRRILENKVFNIYGDGSQIRDFIHVDDLINAIKLCVNKKNIGGELFQVCTSVGKSVREIIFEIIYIMHEEGMTSKIENIAEKDGDLKTNWASNSKICELLNWKPTVALDKGLKDTVQWLVNHYNR